MVINFRTALLLLKLSNTSNILPKYISLFPDVHANQLILSATKSKRTKQLYNHGLHFSNISKRNFGNIQSANALKKENNIQSASFLQEDIQAVSVIKEENLQPTNVLKEIEIDETKNSFSILDSKTLSVRRNVLLPPEDTEDVDFIAPYIKPTFNLAAYADKSLVLQQFLHLGVDLSKWDKHKGACSNLLVKDFETDIKPYVFFIHNVGIPVEELGKWFTNNPFIFGQTLQNLQARVDYLRSKRFTKGYVTQILQRTPRWLNYNFTVIDKRLGLFQRMFKLKNSEIVQVATMDPKLVLYFINHPIVLEKQYRIMQGVMGFTAEEQKEILLLSPRVYRENLKALKIRFDVIHNEMGLSHYTISQFSNILLFRGRKIRERNEFLKFIGKAQYDPKKPGYISPTDFSKGSDAEFCTNVALSSIEVFNDFLKTM